MSNPRATGLGAAVWIVGLVVSFAVALDVLLASPDTATYEANRSTFWWVVGIGAIVYFATACWELRRRKARAKRKVLEHTAN